MPEVRLILVPVDFSAGSEAAAAYAGWLAGQLGARVRLMHAVEPATSAMPSGVPPYVYEQLRASREAVRREAERELEAMAARLEGRDGAPRPEVAVETGAVDRAESAGDTIVRVARDARADLIVMGTHGRSGLRRMLLGSVAEQVVRSADCPVLTLH